MFLPSAAFRAYNEKKRDGGIDVASLGFIGTGNMGSALARAASKVENNTLLLANRHEDKAIRLSAELGCRVGSNIEAALCD